MATAQEKPSDETGAKAEVRGYIPIQLLSLSIPIKSRDGRFGRGVMTVFVVVRGQTNVENFCNFLPRVREAITITIDQSPVPVVGEKYVFQDIGGKLQKAINKVLPAPLVVRLHIFPISRLMGKNAEILELPGTTKECMALKELPPDLEAMLSGKNTEAKSFSVAVPKTPPKLKKIRPRKPVKTRSAPPAIIVNKATTPLEKPLEKKAPSSKDCRPLKEVWPEGFHKASGAVFWLDKAFSLDEDNDGAVDNVGFILKSEDRPELFIYYFPGPGRQSVISVPSLKLGDDRDVPNTCFGKAEYEKPKANKKKPQLGFKIPDLAGEITARPEAKKGPQTPLAAPDGAPDLTSGIGLVFIVAIGAGVVLILGGGLGYVFARRKAERRRKERRRGKEQRQREGRKTDAPPEGPDRRKGEERRAGKRRQEEDRRE